MPIKIPEPWLSFFSEIDADLDEETQLHCLGGFVVTVVYGRKREISDIVVLTLVQHAPGLFDRTGIGSDMYKRFGLYLDPVGIATLPDWTRKRHKGGPAPNLERLDFRVVRGSRECGIS